MKFLYLCGDQGIPILGAKGASVHVREFASALMKLGHAVTLVCAKRGHGNEAGGLSITEIAPQIDHTAAERYFASLRAQIQSPPMSKDTTQHADELLTTELKKLAYNLQLRQALERIIAGVQPDVLYERYSLFNYAGTIVARKFHLPHLLEVNAPLVQERQASSGMVLIDLAQTIEDQVFRQADAVIAVSAVMRDYAIGRGVQSSRVTAIPNGVDLDKFDPSIGNARQEITNLQALGLPADLRQGVVIGFVGSLKPWHGVDVLIQAFARAHQIEPRLHLLVVGEGPRLEHLRSEARVLGLSDHIYFTGAVPHHLIPKCIALMDITVAPYRHQSRFYFSPLKILEYMAMGKPVVATRQGQVSELIVHERNGLLCEPESVESLADAVIRLVHDPDLQRRLGQSAAATVADGHSWWHVANLVTHLADSLLSTAPSGLTRVFPAAPVRTPPRSAL
jgi:glycosyltransferase involved in cell wall biosynthesis